jgi:1-deoxy-D-xylulose-5-phosphate reductoisomerase
LAYPYRIKNSFKRFSFFDYPNLTFEKADPETFKNLRLAYSALKKGGNMPCVLNAANEIAVDAFLNDNIGFLNMSDLIANCMEKITFVKKPTINDYIATNNETRMLAKRLL